MPLGDFDTKQTYKMKWFKKKDIIIVNEHEILQNFHDGQIAGHISVGNSWNTNGYKILCNHL